ncbi:hypothetical protein AGMMS49944_11510 [Spirochaetia bacterium]|nr:hypothetical protein AGMMS49944_11510 [Spirochaetia bacterium]
MPTYSGIQKEELLKARVYKDYFSKFGYEPNIDNIDFVITDKKTQGDLFSPDGIISSTHFLWAEAKAAVTDIVAMLTQLVLTIGKARTFDNITPPNLLGCFDCEKIAFVNYFEIQNIFYQNDFNWKITPSDTETNEFKQVYAQVQKIVNDGTELKTYIFDFGRNSEDLKLFIRENFKPGKSKTGKRQIDKNNFIPVYGHWRETVMPSISVDWNVLKGNDIIDGDFYLADLLSDNNESIKDSLSVLLQSTYYKYNRQTDSLGDLFREAHYKDNQQAYAQFWSIYERPPKKELWDYIIERRDLLVPQDVRERKGSFFTPKIWVELSQKYLSDAFGENWQDEYDVWDCAAGTGNLLAGLTNKYRIWASTLDQQDVDVMHDRIKNGANLLDSHVFQFDFLNDSFDKLPEELKKIIDDPEKRKKLIVYINPPYAEASSTDAVTGEGHSKDGVSINNKAWNKYQRSVGSAIKELFVQFMARVYHEVSECKLAIFSKLKFANSQNFVKFREFFNAEYKVGFIVHADSFDNVKGKFPIGFTVWDLNGKKFPECIELDVVEESSKKKFWSDTALTINQWIKNYTDDKGSVGLMVVDGPDFQKVHQPFLTLVKGVRHAAFYSFNTNNTIEGCIFFAVRLCIEPTWLNDRDQFLFPNDGYKTDMEFQNDCLVFTLFHRQNRISSHDGTNHWIPFTETEVDSRDTFESKFMSGFLTGKTFGNEAQAVLDAGKELWKYYHAKIKGNPTVSHNASYYDIREYFQGRDKAGRMNNTSTDDTYNALIAGLRDKMKALTVKIQPKVYEYGFLKG